ncbi:MAG: tRNA pseudouridine(55) synthase TruB [Gammaproteobacteria bacterium]|nr:tRNA pseudouridine(55) synthase TruB [Gammaproteobacteria bacterium]
MSREVHGILLLDKPLGLSSAAAVARVKRLFGAAKAGHTGSLDPLAEGLLPVCFGEATKFGAHLLDADKTYRVVARLGERTASADLESAVIERRELPPFSLEAIEGAFAAFPRQYDQVPPMHSAIKQDGRPLYEYARAGIDRPREPRRIRLHELRPIGYRAPDLEFLVRCSKGAYIRVLAEDLAASLGTLAHLIALRRTAVAPFADGPYWTLEALEAMSPSDRTAVLKPVDAALGAWRPLRLPCGTAEALRQGRSVEIGDPTPGPVRLYVEGSGFLGVGAVHEGGRLVPERLISATANPA